MTLVGATESRVPVIPVVPELAAANEEHCELLQQTHGEERGRKIFGDGLSNVSIFPNLALVRGDVRMIVPVSPRETHMYQFPAVFEGAPAVINRERIRWEVAAYGAAGMVGSDDAETYERTQHAARVGPRPVGAAVARPGARGRRRRRRGCSSELADETSQRAFWREYRHLMADA